MSEQTFPAWFYGPGGEAEIFQSADDVPKGWKDYQHGTNPDEPVAEDDPNEERRALRTEYKRVTGHHPFNGWDADELRTKIAAFAIENPLDHDGNGKTGGSKAGGPRKRKAD